MPLNPFNYNFFLPREAKTSPPGLANNEEEKIKHMFADSCTKTKQNKKQTKMDREGKS